ncbi:DUF742 domain-containing protein [Nocardia vermiculata]|uniref:DUF742 domain-containing protein n=1 Tax=Nocardia vermiculata TaxID=257274 RepID=A0A846XVA6_9NOCA|nr:DUF742 domain-containing protein [Nocardia vermiculata]NKY49028.1 DUF742 domain-containing protein [Nocardia vermiculata]
MDDGDAWFDADAGPLVRLYAVTHGRGHSKRPELDMLTLVVDSGQGIELRRHEPEYAAIVGLCRTPQSIAELAARLRLPLTMTKVLVGDLIDDGRLDYRTPRQAEVGAADTDLLRALLDGIRGI